MANQPPWQLLGSADVHDQAGHEVGQVKPPVEPVAEATEVAGCVLAVAERLVGTRHHGLEVAENGVDPLELRQIPGLALANDLHRMSATGVGDGSEAGQPVAENGGIRCQAGLCPLGDRLAGKARYRTQLGIPRAAFIADRDCGDDWNLVLGASAGLAASALAAEVSVVNLDSARQAMLGVTRSHRHHDLVVHQPGRGVTHADVTLQRQGCHTGLGLADEVDRQKPLGQRQLGACEQGVGRQRGLVTTGVALEQSPRAGAQHAMSASVAARAAKSAGPASALHSVGAVDLGAERLQELRQGHAVLELDGVVGHGLGSSMRCHQRRGLVAHRVSQA